MMFEELKLIDRNLLLSINGFHTPLMDSIMFYISAIWIFFPLFFFWMFMVYKRYGVKKVYILLIFLGLLITLTDQTSNITKHYIKRYRPTHNVEIGKQIHIVNDYRGGQYGFFSGHSTNSFGIAVLLFLLFSKETLLFRSSFFAWAFVTAYSRMYLGVHYPSDIMVGVIVGSFWGCVVYFLIQFTFKKWFNQTVAV